MQDFECVVLALCAVAVVSRDLTRSWEQVIPDVAQFGHHGAAVVIEYAGLGSIFQSYSHSSADQRLFDVRFPQSGIGDTLSADFRIS